MREAIARAKADEANRQAREELQRVGRLNALSALASTLAHELNQPLAAASNYLTVARLQIKRAGFEEAQADTSSPVEAVDLAAGQVSKAGEIIRQMRAYTNSGEVMARPCVVTKSVDAALETTLASMAPRALSIRKTYTPDLPEVMLDDVQFQQVISNVVRNAIEAMDGQERPELSIEVTRSGDQIAVEVCDNGPGLSDAVQETLFQPFRSSKRRGLGLGLPICRTIIEAHGGKLTGEQRAEGGALFRITLPLADASLSR
jgi:two-component system sensor kinase FixL